MSIADHLSPISVNFTLKDHTYDVLRQAILGMNIYHPDVDLRLDERNLAEQLGISRTPIREALARLSQDGLVMILTQRCLCRAQNPPRNYGYDHYVGCS